MDELEITLKIPIRVSRINAGFDITEIKVEALLNPDIFWGSGFNEIEATKNLKEKMEALLSLKRKF